VSASRNCIEFVYFDLGNVLLSFDPTVACRNLADRFKITSDEAEAAIYRSGLQARFEQGELSPDRFADSIRQQLGRTDAQMPTAEVLDATSDMFTPIESMRGVLQEVHESGCRVGLLSNTCHSHWDWILRQKYFVTNFSFDVTILSFQVESMKPSEAIYQAAEQASDVPADRLLFLDDRQENVEAALRRDWNSVQCFGGQQAIDVLREFRVLGE
jgi:HAD superfamily hydrolase (TIGR01509 family)